MDQGVWHWFFPKQIYVPKCVHELLKFIYPDVDWDRATFHEGWPHLIDADHSAITLPHSLKPGHTRTYFKKGKWDPCSCKGLGLIVHEGFHVLQFQNIAGGWAGIGLANPVTILYLACWIDHGFSYYDHPAEKAAYKVAGRSDSLYNKCCNKIATLPCDCDCSPPSYDEAGLQDFKTNCSECCPEVERGWVLDATCNCTPGDWIKDWAKGVYERGCKSDFAAGLKFVTCGIGLILSGILWAIWGIWYGLWFVLMLIAAVVLGHPRLGRQHRWFGPEWRRRTRGRNLGAISSPFSDSEIEGWLWFTNLDAATKTWQVPDTPITKDGRSRTKASPSIAEYQSNLYAAYKSRDNEDIWYNVFDGTDWGNTDTKITQDGKTRTSTSPSLAAFNGKLYMAYRAASGDDIWYNVFDGTNWLDEDKKITKDGNTRSESLAQPGRPQWPYLHGIQVSEQLRHLVQRFRRH